MFKENRYTYIYNKIIKKAINENRSRGKIYYEQHHIIPKSLGGDNTKSNLVLLTPKEHYICHRLLIKMLEGNNRAKMVYALFFLQNKHKHMEIKYYSGKAYENARLANRVPKELHPRYGKPVSEKQIQRMKSLTGEKALMYGKTHTEESKKKMSASRKGKMTGENNPMFGKTLAEKQKQHLSKLNSGKNNPFYGKKHNSEFANRNRGTSHAMFGKKHSDETRQKIKNALVGKQSGINNHRYGKRPADHLIEAARIYMTGRKFINKDGINKCVTAEELDFYLKDGWIMGRAVTQKNH